METPPIQAYGHQTALQFQGKPTKTVYPPAPLVCGKPCEMIKKPLDLWDQLRVRNWVILTRDRTKSQPARVPKATKRATPTRETNKTRAILAET